MKRILCLLLTFSFLFLISSCGRIEEGEKGREEKEEEIFFKAERLEAVSIYNGTYIVYYRDVATDVMYLLYSGGGKGFTVMMDPETGLPLTYTRYIEVYQERKEKKEN